MAVAPVMPAALALSLGFWTGVFFLFDTAGACALLALIAGVFGLLILLVRTGRL